MYQGAVHFGGLYGGAHWRIFPRIGSAFNGVPVIPLMGERSKLTSTDIQWDAHELQQKFSVTESSIRDI